MMLRLFEEVVYEEHVDNAFPNGEFLMDVEKRVKDFVDYLKKI